MIPVRRGTKLCRYIIPQIYNWTKSQIVGNLWISIRWKVSERRKKGSAEWEDEEEDKEVLKRGEPIPRRRTPRECRRWVWGGPRRTTWGGAQGVRSHQPSSWLPWPAQTWSRTRGREHHIAPPQSHALHLDFSRHRSNWLHPTGPPTTSNSGITCSESQKKALMQMKQ